MPATVQVTFSPSGSSNIALASLLRKIQPYTSSRPLEISLRRRYEFSSGDLLSSSRELRACWRDSTIVVIGSANRGVPWNDKRGSPVNTLVIVMPVVFASGIPAHHDFIETIVTAEKDSSVTSSTTISYVMWRRSPHTIAHFTLTCSTWWEWDHCYPLTAGKDYKAKIDYKRKQVFLTRQLVGNPQSAVTSKNETTNVEYEEEK
jgi:hypothetical protein